MEIRKLAEKLITGSKSINEYAESLVKECFDLQEQSGKYGVFTYDNADNVVGQEYFDDKKSAMDNAKTLEQTLKGDEEFKNRSIKVISREDDNVLYSANL